MDRGEPSLKPEWLVRGVATPTVATTGLRPGTSPRADDQDRGASSRNQSSGHDRERNSQQTSSRRGSGPSVSRRLDRDGTVKSRGYASFGRSNRDRGCVRDSEFSDRESRLSLPDDPLHDGFGSFSSCRPESDRLNRIRPKLDTLTRAAGVNSNNGNLSRKDAGDISFEREFPHLSAEDNNGKHDMGRVPSPGISTPIQSIPLVTAPEGWNSVLAEVPGLSEPSSNHVSSALSRAGSSRQLEVSNCGTALSMAETVMQTPLQISTTPQLSIDAQKIEERNMRQCILRPLTPSSNKITVCTCRKSIAKDKHKFFELLRSKSLNGSSTGIESSSSLVDEQKNSSLDLSLFNAGIKCIETGSNSREDANYCDGSQLHLSDNEKMKPFLEPRDFFTEGLHGFAADSEEAISSSDFGDAKDVAMMPRADKAEAAVTIIPADINDGSTKLDSSYDDARLFFQPIVAREEEPYPSEDEPSPEEMAFLKSLGWKEDEIVPPLKQEEIADCLRHNVRLQQKLEECRG
uniref:Uncharacterized protein n=1 Tax=Avena sativa TaxID=4498 RepID=A0ACD5UXJ3_AVESA